MSDRIVRTYSGLWKCRACGTDENRNEWLHCPNCGASIPMLSDGTPDTYPPPKHRIPEFIIQDEERLRKIHSQVGVWQCRFCQSVSPDDDSHCTSCGASKDGEPWRPSVTEDSITGSGNAYSAESSHSGYETPSYTSRLRESSSYEPLYTTRTTNVRRSKLSYRWILIAAALLLVVGGAIYWATRTHEVVAIVQDFLWERNIRVDRYSWVSETSLSGYPGGSRDQHRNWEQIGSHTESRCCTTEYYTEQVYDGQSCTSYTSKNADGSYSDHESCSPRYRSEQRSRQVPYNVTVPDYGYRYYYEIQRWIFSRNIPTNGAGRSPVWGDVILAVSPADPEREAGRTERYVVVFAYQDEDTTKTYTREMSFDEWREWNANINYILTLNNLGSVTDFKREGAEAE